MEFSHAGGVVVRLVDGEPEYLVVRAKRNPAHWVLPKGHIEPGETPQQAAVREVREEAGTLAVVLRELGSLAFDTEREHVSVVFYLMRHEHEVPPAEERPRAWCRFDDAVARLSFDDARDLVRLAHAFESGETSG